MINYFLGDAARINSDFDTLKSLNESYKCLYQGKSEENLAAVAPYVFPFPYSKKFAEFVIDNGWGNSWGLFVLTDQSIEDAQHHFRKFLMVKTDDGKELFFRFYDPRVLRIFLPTCDAQQLHYFFGTVKQLAMESEDSDYAAVFELENGNLVSKKIPKQEFLNSLNIPLVETEEEKEKEVQKNKKIAFLIEESENRQKSEELKPAVAEEAIAETPEPKKGTAPETAPETSPDDTPKPPQRKWNFLID